MYEYLETNMLTIQKHEEALVKSQQVRNRKLQSVCRIKAAHEKSLRRQTQRESMMQNAAAISHASKAHQAKEADTLAGQGGFPDKKRIDREERLRRRKQ